MPKETNKERNERVWADLNIYPPTRVGVGTYKVLVLVGEDQDQAYLLGFENPRNAQVLATNRRAIVIKWPSGRYWASTLDPSKYAPVNFVVYEIIGREEWPDDTFALRVRHSIDWDNPKPKPKNH